MKLTTCLQTWALGLMGLSLALANPLPQQDSGGNRRTRTDLCSEFEFQEFVADQVSCYAESDNLVDEALRGNQGLDAIKNAICQAVQGKMDCLELKGRTCFDEDELANVRTNFLVKEYERADNNSDILGRDFISNCPILRQNQDSITSTLFGSSACSFGDAQDKFFAWKQCREQVLETRDASMNLLDFISDRQGHVISVACKQMRETKECDDAYKPCLGGNVRSKLDESLAKSKEEITTIFRGGFAPDFSFDRNCNAF